MILTAGCGGGGTNPPTTPPDAEIPEVFSYPAYHAEDEDGDDFYLLIKKEGSALKGEFMYFFANEGETQIMSGPAVGSVEADGTVHLTLTNPYDETDPPIVVEGTQTEAGWSLHDVADPSDVVHFTAVEGPRVTRGLLGNTAKIRINELDQNFIIDHSLITLSLIPVAFLAEIKSGNKSTWSFPIYERGVEEARSSVWVCNWIGHDWTWIDVYREEPSKPTLHTARLWVPTLPLKLDEVKRTFSSAASFRDFTGGWHRATGWAGPQNAE